MNEHDILDMIGDAKESYILDAETVRSGEKTERTKRLSLRRPVLVAALVALMLLLVGCTIAYVQGWFVDFFAKDSKEPLSDSQIAMIEENEQAINESQTIGSWTLELRSALQMGDAAYVMIGVTAPENVSLEPRVEDGILLDHFAPGNTGMAAMSEDAPKLVACSKGVFWISLQTSWEDDGDGKSNTYNYVIKIYPDLANCTIDPFGPEAEYRICIKDIIREYDDLEYKQMLMDTKYKGDYGVMFTHEETMRIHQSEVLAEGTWEFVFTLNKETANALEMEFLTEPIPVEAEMLYRYGDGILDSVRIRKEVTVNSLLLQPLSLTVRFEDCGGVPSFCFDDGDIDRSNNIYVHCILKDGSQVMLRDMGHGDRQYKVLDAQSPIVLEEVDHILLNDGTKVYPGGTVEFGEKEALPAAVENYRNISSNTGVFSYFPDFDGDGIEDLTIWYDGSFRTLCLLNEDGTVRKEFNFDNGMDLHQTYNQRAAEIKFEPYQIRLAQTIGEAEYLRFFRAEEDGLHLNVGVKYDPDGAGGKWFLSTSDRMLPYDAEAEGWESITEEAYRRIVEDYQVMDYCLIPLI